MRLFIAEKPELGRAIAEAINEDTKEKQQGYIVKGDNIITWAFGHILELAEPENYNPNLKQWKMNDLPLPIAYPFKRIPKSKSKDQLNLILKFIKDNQVNEIVHCGDADEEGQILIDEIIEYSKTSKPIKRCLINDITPKAIQKAMANMQSNADFKTLSESGFARAEADWLTGINLTRLYSILNTRNGGEGIVSVGRVQTPILALIVNRELEHKNFKSLEYFAISGDFELGDITINASLKQSEEERITDKTIAENLKSQLENQNFDFSIKSQDKIERPPLPFNLLNLQVEASKLYGFSAEKTLKTTQELREKYKAITYNRSDCEYLPTNLYEESPLILEAIKANFSEDIGQVKANLNIKSLAFDDSKISAHYAIIPTQSKFDIKELSNDEKLIYTLIAKRFLMQFYPPCEYKVYTLEFKQEEFEFTKSIRVDTKLGFKETFLSSKDEEEKEEESLNDTNNITSLSFLESLKELKQAFCYKINLNPTKTKPRPLYTMTTLLKDLNQVGKYVKDSKIKKLLLEKDKDKKGEKGGIGTPATRSNHIETLIKREYISVSKDKKQSIKVLPKGFKLIENLPAMLTGVDMTALWFEQQKEIQNGNLSRQDFLKEIQNFITDLIHQNKESNMSVNEATQKEQFKCPKCNQGFLREINGKFGKFFSCSEYQNGCDYKTKSINGKPDFSPKKEIELSEYDCPKCQKGKLVRKEAKNKKGSFWYGCSEWKNGCNFTCFEKEGKPNLEMNVNN